MFIICSEQIKSSKQSTYSNDNSDLLTNYFKKKEESYKRQQKQEVQTDVYRRQKPLRMNQSTNKEFNYNQIFLGEKCSSLENKSTKLDSIQKENVKSTKSMLKLIYHSKRLSEFETAIARCRIGLKDRVLPNLKQLIDNHEEAILKDLDLRELNVKGVNKKIFQTSNTNNLPRRNIFESSQILNQQKSDSDQQREIIIEEFVRFPDRINKHQIQMEETIRFPGRINKPQTQIPQIQVSKRKIKQVHKQQGPPQFLNYFDINCILNNANQMIVKTNFHQQSSSNTTFKVYIGKGNNSQLVKQLMKQRTNWVVAQSKNEIDINFYWTQTFKEHINVRVREQPLFQQQKQDVEYIITNQFHPLISSQLEQQGHELLKYLKKANQIRKSKDDYDYHSSPYLNDEDINDGDLIITMPESIIVQNHLSKAYELGNKKELYMHLNKDLDQAIPLTFLITNGVFDKQYQEFKQTYTKYREIEQSVWILKPGEDTNRGNGIMVTANMEDIQRFIIQSENTHSVIIQKYIEQPFLYQKRKFDIRCYMLITVVNNVTRAFWFKNGYIRTSSKIFTLQTLEERTHLTNDAIQNKYDEYGKYEKGNKLSYSKFIEYLREINERDDTNYDFYNDVYPKIKELAADAVQSVIQKLDSHTYPSFELFGLDFMLTCDFKPLLIEINTNPCIETGCPVLTKVINTLLENVFRIFIDPLFPFMSKTPSASKKIFLDDFLKKNNFELLWQKHPKQCFKLQTL